MTSGVYFLQQFLFGFVAGLWFGIELDKPVGKNDGSINGKQYFSCQQNYGVFAPSSRIQKYMLKPEYFLVSKKYVISHWNVVCTGLAIRHLNYSEPRFQPFLITYSIFQLKLK